MSVRRVLKFVHFSSTAWFVTSAAFLLIVALRQAGAGWWLIFSLSGYSAVLIFMLISLYLFAVFRGVVQTQKLEHPLTTSIYYMTFYDISPFLGALAGVISTFGSHGIQQLSTICIGSLSTTFFVWIVLDPAIGSIEMMLPASREHRQQRQAQFKKRRRKQQIENRRLLVRLRDEESLKQRQLQEFLPYVAEQLVGLIANYTPGDRHIEKEVVQIGARAWQLGGIICMRKLHETALEKYKNKFQGRHIVDYIAIWWDGIGTWSTPLLSEMLRKTG
ncbi:MAG: hypothetical protein ACYTFK_09315 [Planctomycetota bacterium]|jgi:hypothetical protein